MRLKDILGIGFLTVIFMLICFNLISRVGMMPEAASYEALLIDRAWNGMVKVTVPIFALVLSVLIITLFRFVSKDQQGEGTKFYSSRNGLVEVAWISISLVLTLGLAALGSKEFLAVRGTDNADLNIQVKAAQFSWEFFYPEQNVFSHELILPKDKRARLLLSSEDVVHSFWVPQFRLKQDIVPGKIVKLLFTPTKIGKYTLFCSELCGADHTVMTAPVRVIEGEELEEKLKTEQW